MGPNIDPHKVFGRLGLQIVGIIQEQKDNLLWDVHPSKDAGHSLWV